MIYASRRSQLVPIILPLNQKRGRSVFFQRNFLRRSREENFFEKRKPEREDKTFLIYLCIGSSCLFKRDYNYKI